MNWKLIIASVCAVFSTLALSTNAVAQSDSSRFAVEQFEPLHAQGTNVLNLGKSEVLGEWTPSAGIFFHYVDDPLVLAEPGGDEIGAVVGSQFKTELWAAIGLFGFADLGVVMPLVAYQDGDNVNGPRRRRRVRTRRSSIGTEISDPGTGDGRWTRCWLAVDRLAPDG